MGNSSKKETYNYTRNQPKNAEKLVLTSDGSFPQGNTYRPRENYQPQFPEGTYFTPARPPTMAEERKWKGVL